MGDIRQFGITVDRFARNLTIAAETLQKQVALDLFGRIVRRTPVKTGRARASWTIAVNRPDRSVQPEGHASYPPPTAGPVLVKVGDQIWISNNLPYIVRLEKGSSRQAPQGMVALSVEEVHAQLTASERAALNKAGL